MGYMGRCRRTMAPDQSACDTFPGGSTLAAFVRLGERLAVDRDVLSALFPLRTAKQVRADFD